MADIMAHRITHVCQLYITPALVSVLIMENQFHPLSIEDGETDTTRVVQTYPSPLV